MMNKLLRVAGYQSYRPGTGIRNEYNGLDSFSMGIIHDDRIYALVHDGNLADLEAGRSSGMEFFFDQATYDKYVDPSSGVFDAQALSEALQVKPFQSDAMAMTDGHAEYRNSIACFDRNGEIETPLGVCEANTQFGGGGAHEAFIPEEESRSLQDSGALKFNSEASHIHTGENYVISADDYDRIQAASDERCENCEEKGLSHPEPETCQNGFEKNPAIEGTPFDSKGLEEDVGEKSPDEEGSPDEENSNLVEEADDMTEGADESPAEENTEQEEQASDLSGGADESPAEENAEQEEQASDLTEGADELPAEETAEQEEQASDLTEGADESPAEENTEQEEQASDLTEGADELPAEETAEQEEQASDLTEGADESPAEENTEQEEQASDLTEGADESPAEEKPEQEEQASDLTEGADESPAEENAEQEEQASDQSEEASTDELASEDESSGEDQSYSY